MSDGHRSLVDSAAVALRNANALHEEVLAGDVIMAHGYALVLQDQLEQLAAELATAARLLPEPAWVAEQVNPYRLATLMGATTQEGVARLSDDELLEHCRATNWEREHRLSPEARWWLSKHMSILKQALRDRGLHDQAWRDGSEMQ